MLPPDLDPDSPESSPGRVAVRRSDRKRPVMDASLVLASQGIRHWIEFEPAPPEAGDISFVLTVEPWDGDKALSALSKYDRENVGWRVEDPLVENFDIHLSPLLHLAIPAVFSFWAAMVTWGGWMERQGGAAAARILSGEWWRTLTATTLHADSEHFLGNMLSGYFLFNLLRRRCGQGTSMVLLTLAAALANFTVAAVSPPRYFSIGFSTVTFAALGMLGAMETRFFPRGLRPGLRSMTPLLGALFLAVMTGLGENADVKAHFIGLGYGVLCAPAAFWLERRGFGAAGWQALAVVATWGAYALAWWMAIG